MAEVKEADTERYAEVKRFPIIPCDLCGSQENLQRKQIKALMRSHASGHDKQALRVATAVWR